MFTNTILPFLGAAFVIGCIASPLALLWFSKRLDAKQTLAPKGPSKEALLDAIEHLRDRLFTIENESSEKQIQKIASRARAHAEQAIKPD